MKPETYWRPWLGDWFGLRPADVGDLTAGQMMACLEHASRKD